MRRVQAVVQVKSEDEEQELEGNDDYEPDPTTKLKQHPIGPGKSMYIPEDDATSDDGDDELILRGEVCSDVISRGIR